MIVSYDSDYSRRFFDRFAAERIVIRETFSDVLADEIVKHSFVIRRFPICAADSLSTSYSFNVVS